VAGVVVVVRLSSDCPAGADAVPTGARAAVTVAGVRLQLLGHLASHLHTNRRVWPAAGN
jgi:hypothetical protein